MSQKLSTPKGTRDFFSLELKKRNFLLNVLRDSFESFNFQEIETPSIENLSTLINKYGDEEDSLMFKILSSGEKIKIGEHEEVTVRGRYGLRYNDLFCYNIAATKELYKENQELKTNVATLESELAAIKQHLGI